MGLNKRGFFFTMMAIAIISLFVVSYTFYTQVEQRRAVEKRITTMNNFLFSAEEDLSRQIYVTGYRVIFLLERRLDTGQYTDNLTLRFNEAFYNGTLYSQPESILSSATFSAINNSINDASNEMNININIINKSLEITQEDPWNIKLIFNYTLLMSDKSNLASWNKNASAVAFIPITNFEDPLFKYNTNLSQFIIKSNLSFPTDGSDITNISLQLANHIYINSSDAPSFINRLEGNISANQNGIFHLVDLQNLTQQGITIKDKSVADFIYFSSSNPSACEIAGLPSMPSWFKLDSSTRNFYNVGCK